ncbi:hypothetical protein AMTR_s00097p00111630 [Amborella trichopoda]|uniref:Uncharacterized protein n=1 Tax=Amborella trichopoda TaxID=13333 RepID=W1P289_AMBTC|nr:hypothetical protein AMTR_s00097p00111630 [Amborella trichopoda]
MAGVMVLNEEESGQQSRRNRLQLREGKLAECGYEEEEGEGSKGGPTTEEEEVKMGRLAAATRWLRLIPVGVKRWKRAQQGGVAEMEMRELHDCEGGGGKKGRAVNRERRRFVG